jgi:hypothetical protein
VQPWGFASNIYDAVAHLFTFTSMRDQLINVSEYQAYFAHRPVPLK